MQKKDILEVKIRNSVPEGHGSEVPYGSNCVRLSVRECLVIGITLSALFYFVPTLWERMEKFEPEPDYRLPYVLSSDYWLFDRYCRWATSKYETLVIGDSVVWGHFVSEHNTLSHYLNEVVGQDRFVNLGVDGIHPVALAGLLRYYGRDIKGANVLLHFNPLWMSSRKQDLQIEKEFHFNHPKLVPQFVPDIPCYKDSYSRRLSAVVVRYVPFLSWTSHLKIAYFESTDLPTWTLEHPYESPLKALTLQLPASENDDQNEHISWTEKGIIKKDFQWVELETSLQWKSFQQSIEMLKARNNRIFVLVGPFNEHMLKGKSIDTYRKMKSEIKAWLQRNNVPYYMPEALPSEFYRDASHPLGEGYAVLAKQLSERTPFRNFLRKGNPK